MYVEKYLSSRDIHTYTRIKKKGKSIETKQREKPEKNVFSVT